MSHRVILEKVQGCLLGAMIGDALGMPWESMDRQEIQTATLGLGVTDFVDPVQRRISDTQNLKAGDTTDDWQLTQIVTESLIRCRDFYILDLAAVHIETMARSTFGWGRTTRTSIKALKEFLDSGNTDVANFKPPNSALGCGNGVAIKVAPLAIFAGLRYGRNAHRHLGGMIRQLSNLTHPDPRAAYSAELIAWVILQTFLGMKFHPYSHHRRARFGEFWGPEFLKRLFIESRLIEGYSRINDDSLTRRIARLIDNFSWRSLESDAFKDQADQIGSGFFALESIPFSLMVFLVEPWNFEKAVLAAINAGGDTDSNASMVGAMIGANVGIYGIPSKWRLFRREFNQALELGTQLFEVATDNK